MAASANAPATFMPQVSSAVTSPAKKVQIATSPPHSSVNAAATPSHKMPYHVPGIGPPSVCVRIIAPSHAIKASTSAATPSRHAFTRLARNPSVIDSFDARVNTRPRMARAVSK
ncbi:MAG: hypothetical protein Q6373_005010, partial [Candidatus Sigynarchaeota archaeon]